MVRLTPGSIRWHPAGNARASRPPASAARPRPPTPGDARVLRVPGLRGQVTVVRDRWGIPHVDASDEADAWHALGSPADDGLGARRDGLVRGQPDFPTGHTASPPGASPRRAPRRPTCSGRSWTPR
ncbi:MAG TPA: penicillin acylase family protein [Thermoanaerobaculia bacterium]|nr:penicillin acylase family protein [Thermoanaerobaculia bacterium]